MRAYGDFQKIYEAARSFYLGNDVYGGKPHNPVVRHTTDGVWMLESGIDSEERADAECSLDDFDSYFYETYQEENYIPSSSDEDEFLTMLKTADEENFN